ncbi:hypothetical protein FGG08_004195 [Glutinoglossum americanum]|uniref:Uncharacterized protein n=1 Tax=Glutinoglossum americanum TaxID=1670608 RepID=A0A9P8KXD3_9PEZI|nr:hypothetical protein FGG08_004195 [Glutinoglossum americanum]
MQAAIRWSPHSTAYHQRFLVLNLVDHSLRLYDVEESKGKVLKYKEVACHTNLPACRAYDWSPAEEALVAFGLSSGEANLLRIDTISHATISFPVKSQRACNSVAFNKFGLLATGLDKVRNDFCLNIWDVNQRLSTWDRQKNTGWGGGIKYVEPIRRLSSGESISSIKFFPDQPNLLVTGAASKYVRVYDLRESSGNPSLQFNTKCVHNLSIDARDPNYFASCAVGEQIVCVWDRRGSPHQTGSPFLPTPANAVAIDQPGHILSYTDCVDDYKPSYKPSIWSVRYCGSKRGTFGVLTSTGQLRVFETKQEYSPSSHGGHMAGSILRRQGPGVQHATVTEGPKLLRTKRTRDIELPFYDQNRGRPESERIVSFDFMVSGNPNDGHRAITYRADGRIAIFPLLPPPPEIRLSSRGAIVIGKVETEMNAAKEARTLSAERAMGVTHLSGKTRPLEVDGEGKDFRTIEPTEPEGETVAQTLKRIRGKVQAARKEYEVRKGSVDENRDTGPVEEDPRLFPWRVMGPISSREQHEIQIIDAFFGPPGFSLDMTDFLALQERVVQRRRCKEGYLFNCALNKEIVADDQWLQDLWTWVDGAVEAAQDMGMVYGAYDLSFLGVWAIWNNTLYPSYESRLIGGAIGHPTVVEFTDAVTGINRHFNRPKFNGISTAYPEHRQLCLAICGWAEPPERFEMELSYLENQGLYTKAAGWALFNGLTQRAIKALSKGDPNMKLMSVAVAGYYRQQESPEGEKSQVWKDLTQELGTQLHDPYSRAIFAFVSNGDWNEVINEVSLPLRDRLGVALRFLPDDELGKYLDEMVDEVIKQGDIEGIVLTGITEQAIDLFQEYIGKYNDHQTAVLATSFAAPLYFNDFRFTDWRETYRYDHNTWKLHLQRCRFDVDSVKLSKTRDDHRTLPMPPRQVSLRCNFCQQSVARTDAAAASAAEAAVVAAEGGQIMHDDPTAPTATATPSAAAAELLSAVAPAASTTHPPNHHSIFNNNVVCPSCGRTLPRCAVCMMWLGQPKPHASPSPSSALSPSRTAAASSRGLLPLPLSDKNNNGISSNVSNVAGGGNNAVNGGGECSDPMEHFFNFCLRCNHGFHANHARDWFARHRMCPVPECQCTCAMHAG